MRKIVVSDIFGKTPALDKLSKALGNDVDIIDPYNGKNMEFQTEEQAYEFFTANVGLKTYCDLLQSKIKKAPAPATLIGFSVGASAVWRISESLTTQKVKNAVCFYGSQVRHLSQIRPNVVIDFIMPRYEPGFSIHELATHLSNIKNVALHKTSYLHGFMNELSKNYNAAGYTKYIDWLRQNAG